MLPTPDLSHLTTDDFKHVYEPAEDTFILLDALEKDAAQLKNLKPVVCLEIGSGSGCVSSFIAKLIGPSQCLYLCTDINRHAAQCTRCTGFQNNVMLDAIIGSLTEPFSHRLDGVIDVLIFNPPYVPTIKEEAFEAQSRCDIEGSWAGGASGMEITNKLLDNLKRLLSPTGCFYLVAVKQNDIPSICVQVKAQQGLDSRIVLQRRAGRELLHVLQFFKADSMDSGI